VNENGFFYRFAVSHCAAEAMHADGLKNFRAVGVDFKTIHNEGVFGYFCHIFFSVDFILYFYYNTVCGFLQLFLIKNILLTAFGRQYLPLTKMRAEYIM